jgi:hypothetical protein
MYSRAGRFLLPHPLQAIGFIYLEVSAKHFPSPIKARAFGAQGEGEE